MKSVLLRRVVSQLQLSVVIQLEPHDRHMFRLELRKTRKLPQKFSSNPERKIRELENLSVVGEKRKREAVAATSAAYGLLDQLGRLDDLVYKHISPSETVIDLFAN